MAKKRDAVSAGNNDSATTEADLFGATSRDQIEALTVQAIRGYRQALAKAEAAHRAWNSTAFAAGSPPPLCSEMAALVSILHAQRTVVATLIDRLGFVPRVPKG